MWRCLLPTRCGGWVVVKSLWWRTVCTYCCRSLQRPCTAAFGVPKSSRWRSPLVALTQAPQVSGHRGLAVSVARHRDSDRGGGGGGAHKPDTGVSEEDDHHSFEKVLLLAIGIPSIDNRHFPSFVGEHMDDSQRSFSVENSPVSNSGLPGEFIRSGRERKRGRGEWSVSHHWLQVLQESYLMAFGLLAVAAVSDVVGG